MSKLAWVCGASLVLAFAAAGCSSDDDTTPVATGGSSAGKGGGTGTAGKAGSGGAGKAGAAQGGGTSEAGTGNEPGEGGTAGSEGGAAGSINNGTAGDDSAAGQGGAPATAENCIPDGTVMTVTASGTTAYVIGGLPAKWLVGTGANNPLTLCRGNTYSFSLDVVGHPFYLKTVAGTGSANAYDTGIATTGAVNGQTSGTMTFTVPNSAPDTLFYQCGVHAAMTAEITVVDPT